MQLYLSAKKQDLFYHSGATNILHHAALIGSAIQSPNQYPYDLVSVAMLRFKPRAESIHAAAFEET